MKITILGSGTWGTALGQLLCDNSHEVTIYGIVKEQVDDINLNHQNLAYFNNDVVLPSSLKATMNLKEAMEDPEIIVLAVPTIAIRSILEQIKPLIKNRPYLVSVAKGFDTNSTKRMSELIREIIPEQMRQEVVSLIGPGHAEEVIYRYLTLVTSTSLDFEAAKKIQEIFSNHYFRVYTQTDEIGAEYGVALKNVIAIAAGCIVGLGQGDNARAALLTRGLAEIVRFGVAFGGKFKTFLGLTGLGDLEVTCNSRHSRNFQAGYAIGKANSAKEFLATNTKTVEGIRTAKIVYQLAKENNIEMPITEAVYNVLYNDKKPSEVITQLMARQLKDETE